MSRLEILAKLMERVVDMNEVRWFDSALNSKYPLSAANQERIRTMIQIGLAR